MKVTLLSCTPDALNLLLTTKGTRLAHKSDPSTWTDEQRQEHLDYMRDTIRSSWEFVDYVFKIEGVTRAFTHQLVRTRTGSYAQEAMRVIDARDHAVEVPPLIVNDPAQLKEWLRAQETIMESYANMLDLGAAPQDARGILPTNVCTSIMCKFNLRTLSNMAELRLCTRTQGEYQNVFREMKRLVVETHPWAEPFLQVACAANGRCAFPRYGKKECNVYKLASMYMEGQPGGNDPNEIIDQLRDSFGEAYKRASFQEASPRAKDGKAM